MSMNFVLTGRDHLSRVLDRAGDASDRLGRRLLTMSINGDAAVRRFTNNSTRNLAGLRRDNDAAGKSLGELKKATMLLAPAAIPAAASLAPIAAGAGAVAVAAVAMGAALGPQIARLGEAAEAQKKYEDAVDKSGASSQEAITAQQEYLRLMASMPPATRRAAVAVADLKDEYKDWSDSLAGDTMAPFTKGVAIANALLPRTRSLVKGTAGEADRFMTIIGGEMASPGLDRLSGKLERFSTGVLDRMNDKLIRLLRTTDSGQVGGNVTKFMTWASAQGPRVADVLSSVSTALMHVLQAGSEVGVGLLDVVGVIASLVAAVPPSAIATFLQLALALKIVKAAALGMVAARTALAALGIQLVAMQTAAAAAPGRLRAVTAAIGALSRGAKIAMAGTGIGLLLLALGELSARGKQTPPDVDKLTSSLARLGRDGTVSGEAAKAFGKNLDGLHGKVRALTDPSTTDKVQQFVVSLGGLADWDSTPVEDAKANIDAIDKALAGLVSNGQADLAAAALKRLTAEYGKGGRDTKEFTSQLGDYRDAIADAKFEAELAAESQGLFGAQAQKTQATLAAQKASADGLRQSIQALSDTSRSAFDAETKFEAAVDAVTKSLKDNGKTLDAGTDKGRANRDALSQMATATQDAAAKARENGASWQTVAGIYDKGRKSLVDNIAAITGNRKEAESLASQLLKMPSPKMRLEMRTEDATRNLDSVVAAMKKAPGSKSVTVTALTADAVALLKDMGFKVTRLKDGRFKVVAETANAKTNIAAVQRARDGLKDKSIDLAARDRASAAARAIQTAIAGLRNKTVTITTVRETIATYSTDKRPTVGQGGVSKYAAGGTPEAGEMAMVGENGPELVVFGEAARVFDATKTKAMMSGTLGAGRAAGQGLAAGLGSTGGVYTAARAMAAAVTAGIRAELEIRSPSKKTRALALDIGRGLIVGLTGSRDKIRSTAADLAKDIRAAFEGRKESGLVRMVTAQTNRLMSLAARRDKLAARIAEAKGYAREVTGNARSGAQLGNLGLEVVTGGTIKTAMGNKLSKIRRFTAYIKKLAARGLHKTLLRQILDMGPEQGYAYAAALAEADKATLSSVNKVQYGLDTATRSLGETGADKLYDAGKNAGKGFLTGLQSQQKNIEKLMLKIATSMQVAIRKALGIKSPSTVMARLGAYSTEGLAGGLLSRRPLIEGAMSDLAGVISSPRARASLPHLTVPRQAVRAGGGAGPAQIHIHVDGTVLDPVAVGRQIQTALLELKRARGGAALGFG
ncbi:hypothetical protein ACW4TU_18390 [Streptomyces sp. QTS52]